MALKFQPGRQFKPGDASLPLRDAAGKPGGWLRAAGEQLAGAGNKLILSKTDGSELTLATAEDWSRFEGRYGSKRGMTTFARDFAQLSLGDFLNTVDDLAASDVAGVTLDLRPGTQLSNLLALDATAEYGANFPEADSAVELEPAEGTTSPVPATLAGVKRWGAFLDAPIKQDYQRDRTENEPWADFQLTPGAWRTFREVAGPAALAKLHEPKWDDPEAMALINQFKLPIHLEVSNTEPTDANGQPNFQDHNEMFREIMFDDRAGTLAKAGITLRLRVRFDRETAPDGTEKVVVRRELIQAKTGRQINNGTGTSSVRKFERRYEGSFSQGKTETYLLSGRDADGTPLVVAQKIYAELKEKGLLPADGTLRLEPQYIVLQKRRRSHLQLDTQSKVQTRRTQAQKAADELTAAGQPVPAELTAFIAKLDAQLKLLGDASKVLSKYGGFFPSGECFIVSGDRPVVYDIHARTTLPEDLDDGEGRVAALPLHLETEWDSASSDTFEKALANLDKQLAANPAEPQRLVLDADRKALVDLQEVFKADSFTAKAILEQRLIQAGLTPEPTKRSKDERARAAFKSVSRPVFWM